MTRKPLLLLLLLACHMTACGPATDQNAREEIQTKPPADSLPPDATTVAENPEEKVPPRISPATAKPGFRITRSQVGPIKIGMPVADLKQVIPAGELKEKAITREGKGYKAYEIGPQPAGLLVEETCEPDCKVWRIQVKDPAYRTAEGLGVGSTLGEVKKHYPISFLGTGETEIVAVSAQKKITFMLDVSRLPAQQVPKLNVQNTPDSVKVLGMLIL